MSSGMSSITRNHNIGCHGSTATDLQQKPLATKFGLIFSLNMLSAILDYLTWLKSDLA